MPSVRERTLAHLDNLIRAAGTAIGTGVLLAQGAQQPKVPQVCDPPPPPPRNCCEDPALLLARRCLHARAAWNKVEGRWSVALDLYCAGPVSLAGLTRQDVHLTGATLQNLKAESPDTILTLVPASGAKQITLELPVTCERKKFTLKFELTLDKPPEDKAEVPVKQVGGR